MVRNFTSFNNAAEETGMSRLYGGIYYRNSIKVGMVLGKNVGNIVLSHLQLK